MYEKKKKILYALPNGYFGYERTLAQFADGCRFLMSAVCSVSVSGPCWTSQNL